jgi:uncharacterized protein DUF4154
MRTPLCFLCALLLAAATPACAAESIQLVEQEIKAGLLYNFLKYTDWPPAASAPAPSETVAPPAVPPAAATPSAANTAPMIVCLLDGDPFAGRLQPMAGRTVNQRAIEIRKPAGLADATMCALIVIHADAKPQWNELHAALANKPMLTVSDFPGFSDAGGMIEFTHTDNRIGVKINTDALAAAHLRVQDRLLKLASPVKGAAGR